MGGLNKTDADIAFSLVSNLVAHICLMQLPHVSDVVDEAVP